MERQDKGKILTFSQAEFEQRHRKIREVMQLRGIDCLIITGHDGHHEGAAADLRYVAGLTQAFDGNYIVFPLAQEPILIVASSLRAYWAEKASAIPVRVTGFVKGTRIRDYAPTIVERINELGLEKGTIGIVTMKLMPAYIYNELRRELPYANFVSAGDILLECRMVKSPEEIEFMRKSGECADKGIEAIIEAARPGVSERELVAHCDSAMVKAGAERGNFILLRSGPWSEMEGVIGGGGQRRLQKGDIVLNEITSNYSGYFTQLCVPISIGGDVPRDFMELLRIDKELYKLTLEELRPGNTISAIETKAEKLAASLGGDFRRVWTTQVSEVAEAFIKLTYLELKAGMAYVIHPWTELRSGEGFWGHTIGNTCIVTEGKPEVLNKSPLELKVV